MKIIILIYELGYIKWIKCKVKNCKYVNFGESMSVLFVKFFFMIVSMCNFSKKWIKWNKRVNFIWIFE